MRDARFVRKKKRASRDQKKKKNRPNHVIGTFLEL